MQSHLLLEAAGALLVLYGLTQVYRDIFHPTQSGTLSDSIGALYSALLRHTRLRSSIGPLALVSVIIAWAFLLTLGFALIYTGLLTTHFSDTDRHIPAGSFFHLLLRGIYISLGSFDTFQTFDLAPTSDWLRLTVAVEGLIGISMITASVSWTVLLYPALARTRWFARCVSTLLEAERRTGLSPVQLGSSVALFGLVEQVLNYRIDMVLFPILLNFHAEEEAATPSKILPELLRYARAAAADPRPETRFAGVELCIALQTLSETIGSRILGAPSGDEAHADPAVIFDDFQEK